MGHYGKVLGSCFYIFPFDCCFRNYCFGGSFAFNLNLDGGKLNGYPHFTTLAFGLFGVGPFNLYFCNGVNMDIVKIRIIERTVGAHERQIFFDDSRPNYMAVPIEVWNNWLEGVVIQKILDYRQKPDALKTGPLMPIDGGKK